MYMVFSYITSIILTKFGESFINLKLHKSSVVKYGFKNKFT